MNEPTLTAIELATIAAPIFAASGDMDKAVGKAFDLLEKCSQKIFERELFAEFNDETQPTLSFDDGLRDLGVTEEELRDLIKDNLEEYFEKYSGLKPDTDERMIRHKDIGFSLNDLSIYRSCKKIDLSKKRRDAAKKSWEKRRRDAAKKS